MVSFSLGGRVTLQPSVDDLPMEHRAASNAVAAQPEGPTLALPSPATGSRRSPCQWAQPRAGTRSFFGGPCAEVLIGKPSPLKVSEVRTEFSSFRVIRESREGGPGRPGPGPTF